MAISTTILDQKINVGDRIKVHHKVKEGEKERTQIFTGIVIAIKGNRSGKAFVVRRIASSGVGVERIWPVISPWLQKIEVEKRGKIKRSKLYYLRDRVGKKATRVKTMTKKEEKQKEVKQLEKNSKQEAKNKKEETNKTSKTKAAGKSKSKVKSETKKES